MSNALVPFAPDMLPSTQVGSDAVYDDLAKGSEYTKSLKLYTKGAAIDRGLIRPGHYGVYISKDEIMDLGTQIDVIPFARRPMALDMGDKKSVIRVYDENDPEFKRIRNEASKPNSGCQAGVSILVFERSTGQFYDIFCGTTSTLRAARELFKRLPLTEAQIQAGNLKGVEPHGPEPATLKVQYIQKEFSWHAPTVHDCSTPFDNLPPIEKVVEQINRFLSPDAPKVERVDEADAPRRAR